MLELSENSIQFSFWSSKVLKKIYSRRRAGFERGM
jgi:hypothetical protein